MRPHERIAEAMRSRIRTGVWLDGQMIPGRRRLAEEHGVALTTVERAVASLISEGVLRADDRRGTFVTAELAGGGAAAAKAGGTTATPPSNLVATVGIVSSFLPHDRQGMSGDPWTTRIVTACEHRLSAERGVSQRFFNILSPGGGEYSMADLASQMTTARVDAVICLAISNGEALAKLAHDIDIPLVCGTYDPIPNLVPHAHIDNAAGGVLAARHLRSRGFNPTIFLRPFAANWAEARLAGARAELGMDAVAVWPPELPGMVPQAHVYDQRNISRNAFHELLPGQFTRGMGVIAANDTVAMGFMEVAAGLGFEAGRDYGLVGFDDWERDYHLTSLRPPLEQLGEEAARMAMMLLHGEVCPTRIALPPRLIARTSTLSWDAPIRSE